MLHLQMQHLLKKIGQISKRVGIPTNGIGWPNVNGNPAVITSDISYSLQVNVDLVIQIQVLAYHPEFIDDNGQSSEDIILDGPLY